METLESIQAVKYRTETEAVHWEILKSIDSLVSEMEYKESPNEVYCFVFCCPSAARDQ